MELIKDRAKVEWCELGEGWNGDYNPDDKDDMELLRFDVSYLDDNGEWQEVDNASYCTQFPVKASEAEKSKGLELIMREVGEDVGVKSIKRRCEELSWIDPSWIK